MKKIICLLVLIYSTNVFCYSQTTDESEKKSKESCCPPLDSTFITHENYPEFPGGETARIKFITENMKWPCREGMQGGIVFVRFCVEKDGSISDIEVLHSAGDCFDKEVVRLVEAMPKWKPATRRGEPICMSFVMPIRFTTADEQPKNTPRKRNRKHR